MFTHCDLQNNQVGLSSPDLGSNMWVIGSTCIHSEMQKQYLFTISSAISVMATRSHNANSHSLQSRVIAKIRINQREYRCPLTIM